MDYNASNLPPSARAEPVDPTSVKIIIAGGFGAGKTTLVGSVSEIAPLRTEAVMTEAGAEIDDISQLPGKSTTTVAMDFGRLTIDEQIILYLFGTPGQLRFWFMWDDLCRGAIGAVILVDTRRLADCFPVVDYMERQGLPYVVAINAFDGLVKHDIDEVREALQIAPEIPIVVCDARQRQSTKQVLIEVTKLALNRRMAQMSFAGR